LSDQEATDAVRQLIAEGRLPIPTAESPDPTLTS
jgi:hypothetical protein